MIRHVVLFRWSPGTTPEQIDAVRQGLARLPAVIDTVERYAFGADVGVNEGNADFGVVADFADLEGYLTYRDHPEHQALLRTTIAPVLADRTALQYEVG